jgi:epoxyqueuosine reductase QueG
MNPNETFLDEVSLFLKARGAGLVGVADLSSLPADVRLNQPRAVAFAVPLTPQIVAGIEDGPTLEYHDEYVRINSLLGELSVATADLIRSRGFEAISSAATNEGVDPETHSTKLPHKTVATLAGLGWVGKCVLLVSESFGSAIRLNRVLTDAPLPAGTPIRESRCGACRACVDACPAKAPTGDVWTPSKNRGDFFDALACRRTARETAQRRTGILDTFCGMCIAACPWTKAYIRRSV